MQQSVAARMLILTFLVTAASIAATGYLGGRGAEADTTALTNVRAAAGAADAWYQDPFGGSGSYAGLSAAGLAREAPAVLPHVHVTVLARGAAFCLDDEEASGHSAYYVGGDIARVANLGGAAQRRATLVHSTVPGAAAVCANAS